MHTVVDKRNQSPPRRYESVSLAPSARRASYITTLSPTSRSSPCGSTSHKRSAALSALPSGINAIVANFGGLGEAKSSKHRGRRRGCCCSDRGAASPRLHSWETWVKKKKCPAARRARCRADRGASPARASRWRAFRRAPEQPRPRLLRRAGAASWPTMAVVRAPLKVTMAAAMPLLPLVSPEAAARERPTALARREARSPSWSSLRRQRCRASCPLCCRRRLLRAPR